MEFINYTEYESTYFSIKMIPKFFAQEQEII